MFNISDFRSNLDQKKLLRTNKFKVVFYCPNGLYNNSLSSTGIGSGISPATVSSTLEFWCEAATIPGYNLLLSENRRYGYGPLEKKPVSFWNNDAYFSIIGDANGDNYRFFRDWLKLCVNGNSTKTMANTSGITTNSYPYDVSYKDDYFTNVEIYVYSETGQYQGNDMTEVLMITLRDAFPTSLGDCTLNWGDLGNYMRIPVSFSFFDSFEKAESTNSSN